MPLYGESGFQLGFDSPSWFPPEPTPILTVGSLLALLSIVIAELFLDLQPIQYFADVLPKNIKWFPHSAHTRSFLMEHFSHNSLKCPYGCVSKAAPHLMHTFFFVFPVAILSPLLFTIK